MFVYFRSTPRLHLLIQIQTKQLDRNIFLNVGKKWIWTGYEIIFMSYYSNTKVGNTHFLSLKLTTKLLWSRQRNIMKREVYRLVEETRKSRNKFTQLQTNFKLSEERSLFKKCWWTFGKLLCIIQTLHIIKWTMHTNINFKMTRLLEKKTREKTVKILDLKNFDN